MLFWYEAEPGCGLFAGKFGGVLCAAARALPRDEQGSAAF